jgi:hypothetical protein
LSNGKQGTFDVTPYLDKGVFLEFKDREYFRSVKAAFGGVMWPHEQDFSAETIEFELQQEDRSNPSLQRTAYNADGYLFVACGLLL